MTCAKRRYSSGRRSCVPRTGCSLLMGNRPGTDRRRGGWKALLGGDPMSLGFRRLLRLDLSRLLLDQRDEMVDDAGVLQTMVRQARYVNLVGIVAAAGEPDVGLA